jgi:hypothetical protein
MIKKKKINNNNDINYKTYVFNVVSSNVVNNIIEKFNMNNNNVTETNELYDSLTNKKIEKEIGKDINYLEE